MARPWHFVFDDAVRDSRDLTTSERALLYVLRTHADGRTGVVDQRFAPSLATLADETGMARRSVSRVLKSISEKGWVIVYTPTTREALAANATNTYVLRIPADPRDTMSRGAGTGTPRDTMSPGVVTQTTDPRDTRSHNQTVQTESHSAGQRMGSAQAPTAPAYEQLAALATALGSDDPRYVRSVWDAMTLEDGIRYPDRFAAAKADAGELDGYLDSRGWA